jgi:N-acetylmuramoyl-L-alanine amidase CwlA
VKAKNFGVLPPTFLVVHHTWKPTKAQWSGQRSINGLKSYYESKGWPAGPHLFIADDGIWLFTDMYDVGIHAGVGNGTLKSGYSIGIEVVGNYDGKVWDGETEKNTIGAIKALTKKLNISEKMIKFHRDFSTKTCPGTAITKDWLINKLNDKPMSTKNYDIPSAAKKLYEKHGGDFDDSKKKEIIENAENIDEKIEDLEEVETKVTTLLKETRDLKTKIEEAGKELKKIKDGRAYFWNGKEFILKEDPIEEPRTFGYHIIKAWEIIKGVKKTDVKKDLN